MRARLIGIIASLLIGAAVSAQQPFQRQTEATPTQPLAGETQALWSAYERAVFDSGVYQRWNVRALRPIVADDKGSVLVVTLGSKNGDAGTTITAGAYGLWVTGVPEVQTICRGFHGDVSMQLRELLGLPPDADIPRFLVMSVAASDLFRPSPDDNISTRFPCALQSDNTIPTDCGNAFPGTTTPAHYQWIAIENFYLHSIPNGYPWTHLGYTYNWTPGADRYGASEYVMRPGTMGTIVSKATVAEYCSAP
ncbi:MAG TPA: hypothetical protein VJ901_00950 [Thermoanaerobaculia bacterium]|nr:hypothetical protein [Thermoanaerobaculia bacterium]